jgi:uncharacterized protein
MENIFFIIVVAALIYLALTLAMSYLVQQYPRQSVVDPPDWGRVTDTRIPAADGGSLELWRIEPEGASRGIVVFMHGWGRNRDRMVERARLFGCLGYTAVIHSARDHGGSSPCRFMNALKFAEDIEAVLDWVGGPVILYGHSAGAGGAAIAAQRDHGRIRALFLEACYADTRVALLNLYRWANPVFGALFGPMILNWLNLFYRNGLDRYSPGRLAAGITVPVMLVHGGKDRRFPPAFAHELRGRFAPEQADLFVAPDAGHSDASRAEGYAVAVARFLSHHRAGIQGGR